VRSLVPSLAEANSSSNNTSLRILAISYMYIHPRTHAFVWDSPPTTCLLIRLLAFGTA
jgi:hypothetical protein